MGGVSKLTLRFRSFFGLRGAIEGYLSPFRLQVTIVVAFLCSSLFLEVRGVLFQTFKNSCTEDYSLKLSRSTKAINIQLLINFVEFLLT